ncbi:terminase small subunit [Aquamicrobium phage P14]|uniref:Putative DNA maturase A n=1 Tax=Aquamicrobium phage P14 TaxID=1927013 RepID=A0A1L5C072_9CAUD|nr:terminase small subunit [Aquamicrobium phage P14]APL99504.1 putative DNA maturase A [Aquamicrobium phage P14]
MAASEQSLGVLHQMLADDMLDLLKKAKNGEVELTAANRQVIAKFLKDNMITKAPDENNALGAIERQLAEREARRRALSEKEIEDAVSQEIH